jgi:hypothetical protein
VNKSKKLQVHKCILAAQSEVFEEMFKKDLKLTEMKVEDLKPEGIEEFFRCLYTGEIDESTKASMEIYALASKLKIPQLKIESEKIILNKIDESNAWKAFSLAHTFESNALKLGAFKEIEKMFPDRRLPPCLIDDLETVKELIKAKEKIDALLKKAKNKSKDKSTLPSTSK